MEKKDRGIQFSLPVRELYVLLKGWTFPAAPAWICHFMYDSKALIFCTYSLWNQDYWDAEKYVGILLIIALLHKPDIINPEVRNW